MYKEMDPQQLGLLCSNKETKNKELTKIYNEIIQSDVGMKFYILSLIASNENASLDLLTKLKSVDDALVKSAVINNPRAPKEWRSIGGSPIDSSIRLTGFKDIFGG